MSDNNHRQVTTLVLIDVGGPDDAPEPARMRQVSKQVLRRLGFRCTRLYDGDEPARLRALAEHQQAGHQQAGE
jgi:hypothetical protein